jgi:hypothetical protein
MIINLNLIIRNYNKNIPLYENKILEEKYGKMLDEKIKEPIGKQFKKFGSVNHVLWAKNLVWMQHFPEHKTYIHTHGVNLYRCHKKKSVSMNKTSINYCSTPRGIVYINRNVSSNKTLAVTSHFFDRLSQRVYDNEITRMQAILKFITSNVDKGHAIVYKNSVRCINKNGVAFGIANYSDTNGVFILLSTFVSRDMLTKKQLAALDIIAEDKRFIKARNEAT